MSKKLLKILAICIFVTLIPVAVVAIALAATLSAPYTIAVEFKGTDAALEATYPAAANISVNDQLKDGYSVGVKMDDKITITLADGAYDVVGFYAGNAESVTADSEKLTDSSSYSFNATDSATITIWVKAKSFNIKYTEESVTGGTMTYGQELAKVVGREDFVGWQVESSSTGVQVDNTIYTHATFPVSGDYTLSPVYQEFITINYYNGDTLIAQDTVYQSEYETYALRGKDDEKVAEAVEVGYTFAGWENNVGEVISEVPAYVIGEEYNLYLVQKSISYTANVKFHAYSDETSQVSVNLTDGFTPYNVERENYTFVGFNHNGIVYQVNEDGTDYLKGETSLAQVIASSYKETDTVEVTAVWKSAYENTRFRFVFGAVEGLTSPVYYIDDNLKPVKIEVVESYMVFNDESNYDLNDTIYDFFFQGRQPVGYTSGDLTAGTIWYDFTTATSVGSMTGLVTDKPFNEVTFADMLGVLEGGTTLVIQFRLTNG